MTTSADILKIESQVADWQGRPAPKSGKLSGWSEDPAETINFKGPGEWKMEKPGIELGEAKRIFIRLAADKPAACSISFLSENGRFSVSFDISVGEQVKIVPVGVFSRHGESPSWSLINGVVLKLESQCELSLIKIEIANEDINVPDDGGLWLLDKITRINHIGTAWPVRAILDMETYPARVENAAVTMQKWLAELYGVRIPINPEGITAGKKVSNVILIGKNAALKANIVAEPEIAKQGYNGFVVKTLNSCLAIAGGSIQGLNYGVYKYLEKNGLKFFALNVFTRKTVNEKTIFAADFEEKPFFEGKRISAPFCIYGDGFSLGDPRTAGIDAEYPCDETLWIDHTAAFLVPKKIYLADHPEYYILRSDGKRIAPDTPDVRLMVCQTDPGGIKVASDRALKWIEAQNDKKYFVVQQGDDMEACVCKGCEAKRKEGYNESDLMLNWVNSIAKVVAKKYPDKYLLCYAYVDTQPAPNKLKLEPNVHLLYAPWPTKLSAPNGFRDFDAPENVIAGTQLNDWIKQCGPDNIGIYDYNSYGSLTLRGMADRVKWLAKRGMKGGFWYCGTPHVFPNLFKYVHSQLNWDPFQNTQSLEKEFIRAYYGAAAPAMKKITTGIFDRLDADDRNKGRAPSPFFFEKDFTAQMLKLFDEALATAPENLKAEIQTDKNYFIDHGLNALKPANRPDMTDEQSMVFCELLKQYLGRKIAMHPENVKTALAQDKPAPTFEGLANRIWGLTHVKVDFENLKEVEIPGRLLELRNDPAATIKKYRITDFTEKIPEGLLLPAMSFSGAEGPRYYKWKCEGKVAAWVRGSMTDVSVMKADFNLDESMTGLKTLEIEGQDSDKLWCPPVPVRISVNDKLVFEGPNGFVKHGWSRLSFNIPENVLKPGKNSVMIENLANSDNQTAHWFMISEVKIKF